MAPDPLDADDPDPRADPTRNPGLDPRRLSELEERVRKARGQKAPPTEGAPPSKLGLAFRLVTELLAGVIVGGAIGWALDRALGTSPILLIVMFFVGVAAGFRNVIRTAQQMDEGQKRPNGRGNTKG